MESEAGDIARAFQMQIRIGIEGKQCLEVPHLILLKGLFYEQKLRPLVAQWMALLFFVWGLPVSLQKTYAQTYFKGFTISELAQLLGQNSKERKSLNEWGAAQRPEVVQALILARLWTMRLGKHVLSKIHRVQ